MTPSVAHLPLQGLLAGFYRFSVSEYHRLREVGILSEEEDLELLEGYLVRIMPGGPLHDDTLHALLRRVVDLLPDGWEVRCQGAVTLSDSEPEPDLIIGRTDPARYMHHHPARADIGLIIEVADSTLDSDRTDKCRIYARAGIPIYWIVNLADTRIEVYTSPVGDPTPEYRVRTDRRPGEDIDVILDGRRVGSVSVAAVFA